MTDNLNQAIRCPQSGFNGIVEPRSIFATKHQPIHNQSDIMILSSVELRGSRQSVNLPVHEQPYKALPSGPFKKILELSLSTAHQRRNDLDFGTLAPVQNHIHHLCSTLPYNR